MGFFYSFTLRPGNWIVFKVSIQKLSSSCRVVSRLEGVSSIPLMVKSLIVWRGGGSDLLRVRLCYFYGRIGGGLSGS